MSHAKMYSREHSDVQMIAFIHAQYKSNPLHETNERHVFQFVKAVQSAKAGYTQLLEAIPPGAQISRSAC